MAVDIGGRSWPLDIRLRPRVFRPHIGLLTLRYLAGGDVRPVATNGVESGRFHGFLLVLTGNMSDQVITVRCGIFFPGPTNPGFCGSGADLLPCRTLTRKRQLLIVQEPERTEQLPTRWSGGDSR